MDIGGYVRYDMTGNSSSVLSAEHACDIPSEGIWRYVG